MFTSCTQTQGELRTLYYFMPAVIAVREVMLRKAPTSGSLQAHIDTHTQKHTVIHLGKFEIWKYQSLFFVGGFCKSVETQWWYREATWFY